MSISTTSNCTAQYTRKDLQNKNLTVPSHCHRSAQGYPNFGIQPFRSRPGRYPKNTAPRRGRPPRMVKKPMENQSRLENPKRWAATIAVCALEAIEGLRSPSQLSRWLSTELYSALEKRCACQRLIRSKHSFGPVRVHSVHCYSTISGAQEISVVLSDGNRVRAAALRLENHYGHWLTTALEIG